MKPSANFVWSAAGLWMLCACAAQDGASGKPPRLPTGDAACSTCDDAGALATLDAARLDGACDACSDAAHPPDASALCTRCGACEHSVVVASAAHVTGDITYADAPPAGGDHNPCWGAFGVHDSPLSPAHWVHNLEHGGVAFLYACPDGCAQDVAALAALVQGKPQALLTAYADMPTRFAVVSWGQRLKSDCLDLAAFEAFYRAHVDQAPESITAGPPVGCF